MIPRIPTRLITDYRATRPAHLNTTAYVIGETRRKLQDAKPAPWWKAAHEWAKQEVTLW